MKKQNVLINLGLVLSLLFCMAFSCNDNHDQTQPAKATGNLPPGEYALMSVTSMRADGTPNVNIDVNGSLILKTDGTYEHDIWVSNSPGGCGPGTYRITGSTLRLMPGKDTGCDAQDWSFIYDEQMNKLSLRDGNVTLLYCVAGKNKCFKEDDE